jgi:hypothetical protein
MMAAHPSGSFYGFNQLYRVIGQCNDKLLTLAFITKGCPSTGAFGGGQKVS